MAKKITWLDNFAEAYGKKEMSKTASKKKCEEIILDKNLVKGAKLGDRVKLNGKMWKIADLDFVDEKGPGVIAEEIPMELNDAADPMAMEMGTPAHQSMENKCTVAPERAYTDPGNIFDLDAREQEQAKFEGEAAATANQMQQEQSVDRTQRTSPINLPKLDGSAPVMPMDSAVPTSPAEPAAPEMAAPQVPAAPSDISAPAQPAPAAPADPMAAEPAMEDDFEDEEIPMDDGMEDEDDYEEADDLDIAKDELEEEEEAEEDEDEDEKLMASLASNRILKRILTAKRR